MCAGYLSSPYAEGEYMDCMRDTMDYSKYANTNTNLNVLCKSLNRYKIKELILIESHQHLRPVRLHDDWTFGLAHVRCQLVHPSSLDLSF